MLHTIVNCATLECQLEQQQFFADAVDDDARRYHKGRDTFITRAHATLSLSIDDNIYILVCYMCI